MKKRIAIDLNGVIRDYAGRFLNMYSNHIDTECTTEYDDIDSFNMSEVFHFDDPMDYQRFVYEDFAFELFGRADMMSKNLDAIFTDWSQNVLRNLDVDEDPEVMFFSPFEYGLTITSTFAFLSAHTFRVREVYFPVDSMTIYDRSDIVITTNPNLIENCPEGKTVIKINAPYNKDVECELSFDSLMDVMRDPDEKIIKLIENDDD